MSFAYNALEALAAEHAAKFLENAQPATARQIRFIIVLIRKGRLTLDDVREAVDFYNGGNRWGFDKECASVIISTYAKPEDLREAAERRK